MRPVNTGAKQAGGKFRKGVSGNPSGKPVGARSATTRAIETLLEGEAEAITRRAIEAALDGDITAIRLVMDRLAPPRRDRVIAVDLPEIERATDAEALCLELLRATLSGKISPDESLRLAGVVEVYRKAAETALIEQRLEDLEQKLAAKGGRAGGLNGAS